MIPAEIKFDANATPPQWTDDGEQVIEKGTNIRIKIKGLRSEVDKMYAVGTMKEVREATAVPPDDWLITSRIILAHCHHSKINASARRSQPIKAQHQRNSPAIQSMALQPDLHTTILLTISRISGDQFGNFSLILAVLLLSCGGGICPEIETKLIQAKEPSRLLDCIGCKKHVRRAKTRQKLKPCYFRDILN